MRKRITLFAVILAVSLLAGVMHIEVANANPTTMSWFRITIESPKNVTYYPADTIFLNISVEINEIDPENTSYYYNLDSNDYRNSSVKIMEVKGQSAEEFNGTYYCNGSVVLPSLSVGEHKVTVFRGVNGSDGLLTFVGTPADEDFSIEPAPFPAIAILITIALAAIALTSLVYFKRRRRTV
jgi:hypothetical protein